LVSIMALSEGESGGSEDDDEEESGVAVAATQETTADGTPEGDKKMPAKKRRGRPPGKKNNKEPIVKPTVPKKRAKFTDEEDIILCKAWKNTSQSPITGTNQSGAQFWLLIKEAYDALIANAEGGPYIERTQQSLLDRFQRNIQKEMNFFNGFYIQRKRLNESGKNDQDRIADAIEDFKLKMDGNKFRFPHCIEVLWECPQFSVSGDYTTPTSRPPSRASRNSASSPIDHDLFGHEDDDDDEDDAVGPVTGTNNVAGAMQGANLVRPKGSKAAKMQRKIFARREFWNRKKYEQMKKLTKATNDSTKMLRYSTFQNSISARIGHYIMLGQNETALRLLRESEGTLELPDEVDENDDDDGESESDIPRPEEEEEEEENENRPKKKSKIVVDGEEVEVEDHESV
jgi:hypothetical protein